MALPYTFGCSDKICWYAKCQKPERLNCEAHKWAVREYERLKQEGRIKPSRKIIYGYCWKCQCSQNLSFDRQTPFPIFVCQLCGAAFDLSKISELTAKWFFPTLSAGVEIKGTKLKLERRNVIDIYDIDFHILKNGTPVAYIDNEQRYDDYPFGHPYVPINIPLHSQKSNRQSRAERPLSTKAEYYIEYPNVSFHLTRRLDFESAICSWAKDFADLEPVWQETRHDWGMRVWQVPRYLTCQGYRDEPTIENWILGKLDQEGLLE